MAAGSSSGRARKPHSTPWPRSLPAQVGMAVEPLGSEEVIEFGTLLHSGHAWSSIKPAILSTVLAEQGEQLGAEEESWAEGAITASDNEDAADLFHTIEGRQGGLDRRQRRGRRTPSTKVAAPAPSSRPRRPPGRGVDLRTDGVARRRSGALLPRPRDLQCPTAPPTSRALMEQVIPEQRWGLGEASWPSGDRVGMKGGWGPDTEANGGYLVRQSGFVQDPGGRRRGGDDRDRRIRGLPGRRL